MKTVELEGLEGEELSSKLNDAREELFNLRFQHATGQLDDPMRLRQVRKDIARIMTVIKLRQIASENS